jgi:hypothetical protein
LKCCEYGPGKKAEKRHFFETVLLDSGKAREVDELRTKYLRRNGLDYKSNI